MAKNIISIVSLSTVEASASLEQTGVMVLSLTLFVLLCSVKEASDAEYCGNVALCVLVHA